MLGRLRGKTAPRAELVDRLHRIHPEWRLHWFPATTSHGDPRWVLASHVQDAGSDYYREMGRWRLRRLEETRPEVFIEEPITPYGCELMIDGGVILGMYEDQELGTDEWWAQVEAMRRLEGKIPELAQREVEAKYKSVSEEVTANDDYCAYWWDRVEADPKLKAAAELMDATAREALGFYAKGRRSAIGVGAHFLGGN